MFNVLQLPPHIIFIQASQEDKIKDIELQVLSKMFFSTKVIWLANCLICIIYSPIYFYFLYVFLCTH